MAKLGGSNSLRKIGLDRIISNGNVRARYEDIGELADSIKRYGQLSPVLVKPPVSDSNGNELYELISGHRRFRAIQALHDDGEGFTTVDALVITGDKLTLQLIENLQRSDLTAAEREQGIWQMCQNGLDQKEVAARLSKNEMYISRHVLAHKVREAIQGPLNASGLSTTVLYTINTARPEDYVVLARMIIAKGGTKEAAIEVFEEYKVAMGRESGREKGNAGVTGVPRSSQSEKTEKSSLGCQPANAHGVPEEDEGGAEEGRENENAPPRRDRRDIEEKEAPSRQVDFRGVCRIILRYKAGMKGNYNKRDAANDILALLHDHIDEL